MKGSIILNGNIKFETDFIYEFKDQILFSNHTDPEIRKKRKVLLITAAWQTEEYNESHIKRALNKIGIHSDYENGFDKNIQNLSIYHGFNEFKKAEPEIYKFYHEKQENIIALKNMYRRKNAALVRLLRNQHALIRSECPDLSFTKIMNYELEKESLTLIRKNIRKHLIHYYCRDIKHIMKTIVDMDNEMVDVCKEIDDYFFKKSKIAANPTYIKIRNELEKRVLSSNSIFIFGGNVAVLLNRLNFFRLKDAFWKALENGSNFYTVSAGSDILCEKIVLHGLYNLDDSTPKMEFEFFDNGFGIISKITVFPHCHDRIRQDDPESLSYLAHRFKSHLCIGLDQHSFLKLETYLDKEGKIYERFVSAGKNEGVYVFDKSGRVIIKNYNEELEIPGTELYEKKHL